MNSSEKIIISSSTGWYNALEKLGIMIDYYFDKPEELKKLSDYAKSQSAPNLTWTQSADEIISRQTALFRHFNEASEIWNARIKQIVEKIEIPDTVKVIERLKSSQYVFWDYLSRPFIEAVLYDSDSAIFEYESENDYAKAEMLIATCGKHPLLKNYRILYNQTVSAYRQGLYNLAAVGLTAIIDAVMSESTRNATHKPKERYEAILDKLIAEEFVADQEYSTLALFMTFNATATSFYKTVPFTDEEPKYLNRNWIMHGRTTTEKTRIDCIKLLRYLYGIILINYIDDQGVVQKEVC